MSSASRSCVAAAVAVALFHSIAPAGAGEDAGSFKLTPLANNDAGGGGSAEIVAFDASTQRLFLVNDAT